MIDACAQHNDNYFEGDISEVSFYDFSVSADDVATMYGAGASGQDGQGHHATGDHPVEIWIGFHDRDTEAGCTGESFVWTDATPTHFQAWSAGEPNDWLCSANGESQNGLDQNGAGQTCGSDCDGAGNGELATSGTVQHEDCTALLKGRDWGWNDYHCDLQLQFICGFCTASCAPTGFQYFDTPMTMPAAEAYCVEQGGHLASVHSVDDVFTLMSLVPSGSTRDFWIGLHDRDELGAVEGGCSGETFIWTDGTDNDFSNFSPGEPNDWSDGQAHCTTGCDGYWSPSGGGCQDDAVGVSGGTGGEDCGMIDPNRIAGGEDDTGPTSRYGAHPIAGRDGTMQMNDGVCESEKPFACGETPSLCSEDPSMCAKLNSASVDRLLQRVGRGQLARGQSLPLRLLPRGAAVGGGAVQLPGAGRQPGLSSLPGGPGGGAGADAARRDMQQCRHGPVRRPTSWLDGPVHRVDRVPRPGSGGRLRRLTVLLVGRDIDGLPALGPRGAQRLECAGAVDLRR